MAFRRYMRGAKKKAYVRIVKQPRPYFYMRRKRRALRQRIGFYRKPASV